jgi:hypothetical protein
MAARQHSALGAAFLGRFLTESRYDAITNALDWRQEDVAAYLDKSPAAISRNSTSATSQDEQQLPDRRPVPTPLQWCSCSTRPRCARSAVASWPS